MLQGQGDKIVMIYGNYGIELPITMTITNENDEHIIIANDEKIKFVIKKCNEIKYEKDYTNVENNTIYLNFTQEESELLLAGEYTYSIDWYKENIFKGTLVNGNDFIVEKRV